MLLSLMLISQGCGSRSVVVKPDGALTVDMVKPAVIGNTCRDIAEAYVRRGAAIDDGNARFKAIREQ